MAEKRAEIAEKLKNNRRVLEIDGEYFDKADRNGDKLLTESEFRAYVNELLKLKRPIHSTGKISMQDRFTNADSKKSGRVSLDEAK